MKKTNPFNNILEAIVSKPLRATFVVGSSIILLQALISYSSNHLAFMGYFKYIVPFLPPFFITRTAKRINQRKAEHDFIKDAEPIIFIAFPNVLAKSALLSTAAEMISDSSLRHLNTTMEEILSTNLFNSIFLENPKDGDFIVEQLVTTFKSQGKGLINNYQIKMKPNNGKPIEFILNSVLTNYHHRLKWQATLIKLG